MATADSFTVESGDSAAFRMEVKLRSTAKSNRPPTNSFIRAIRRKSELLNIATNRKSQINLGEKDGLSPLQQAALMGNLQGMKTLIEAGANVSQRDGKGMTALHYAVCLSFVEPASLLLKHNADVRVSNIEGLTPMHFACQHGLPDMVSLLIYYRAEPALRNKVGKTPFDLACEYGRLKVVEILLETGLVQNLLFAYSDDTTDPARTTCFHLAAKNGHIHVITKLLESGCDINRRTFRGTALHEAVFYGRLDVVAFLLQAGADATLMNGFDKTPLDCAKTSSKSEYFAKEAKLLIKEASQAVYSRAICDRIATAEDQLSFNVGDLIWIVDRNVDSRWKGVISGPKYSFRSGYLSPSDVHLVDKQAGMQRSSSQRHVKKVSVPTVPDIPGQTNCGPTPIRNSSSSYGTLGSQDDFLPASPSPFATGIPESSSSSSCDSAGGKSSGNGHIPNFPFNGRVGSPDPLVVGSPRHRNSTGSSSSQASSGFESMKIHTLKGDSLRGDSPPSRNSYHSSGSGSSSLGSLERLDESGYASQVNVSEMVLNGIPDVEVIVAWLQDLRYEEYIPLFLNAGYDLPTIARMTPEDLTAIGITKPGHRKRLTQEIHRLNIHDNLPNFKPVDVNEWLHCLRLGEYSDTFASQNYTNLDQVSQLSWEDLTDIGVKKLGHLKKFVLALKRLKDLKSVRSASSVLVHQAPSNHDSCGRSSAGCSAPPGEVLVINCPTAGKTTAEVRPYCHQQQNGQNLSNSNLVTFQQLSPRGMVNSATSDELLSHQHGISDPLGNSPAHRHMSHSRYQQLIVESQLTPGSYDTFPPRGHQNSLGHNNDQPDCRPTVSVKPRPVAKITAKRNSGEIISNGNCTYDSMERLKNQANNEQIYANCQAFPSVQQHHHQQQQINSVVGCQNLSPRRLPAHQRLPPPPVPPKRIELGEMGSRRIAFGSHSVPAPLNNGLPVFQLSSGANLNDSVELSPATSVEDFPPPPSPITCSTTIQQLRSMREAPIQPEVIVDSPIPGAAVYQQNRNCHSASGSPATGKKPIVPVLPSQAGRNDSLSSIDSSGSGDTIPFANENVGTIRQRSPRGNEMEKFPDAVSTQKFCGVDKRPAAMEIFSSGALMSDRSKPLKSDVDAGNVVLDDIGNMLQTLTDELDAMLLEKR